ncbi:ATP-binding protein [Dactylosporangium sp. NPDC000555]|uniref:sensor histidine kinase n=1 Tax=Dactylosporangium sp. NPDC000555 TaxID=3154260 RepID=UPI00332D1848
MDQPCGSPAARTATLVAGIAGAALLVATAPRFNPSGGPVPLLGLPLRVTARSALAAAYAAIPVVAIVIGLVALRRWPLLLLAGGLLGAWPPLAEVMGVLSPEWIAVPVTAARPLVIVGVLAAAQSLIRSGETGRGATVAGLALGSPLLSLALTGPWWLRTPNTTQAWYLVVIAVSLAAAAPAAWLLRRGDRPAVGGRQGWSRLRLILAGSLAVALILPMGLLTGKRLAALLGVAQHAMTRHGYVEEAVVGTIMLAVVAGLAVIAGPWSLGGALTAATVQVAVAVPMLLAIGAVRATSSVAAAVIAGLALGGAFAWSRWRFALAAAVTVAAAAALFIAYAATTGHPERLATEQSVIPGLLIAGLVAAATAAIVGACAPALAPSGAVPAALGPLAGMLAIGGQGTVQATYILPESSYFNSVNPLTMSVALLLVAAAATGGLGFAQQWTARRAERRHAEEIRREAADAERNRLARPIHDGVLQVLALMQRHGGDLGGPGPQLAALAGEQEVALRNLLSGATTPPPDRSAAQRDLRAGLAAVATATVEVATPADPVLLADATAAELTAAIHAALDNVRRHAGPDARAWILLEDEGDAVRVTVRDDGVGFPPDRLTQAADAGRLGVAQSMRGRIADLGGRTEIFSRPGRGTEVEFWVPRR